MIESNFIGGLGADGKVAAGVSAGAGVASAVISTGIITTLFTSAAVAQAVPVVGQIVGAIALTAGLIAKAKAKAAQINASTAGIESQNAQLRLQSADLDTQISQTNQLKASINAQIQKLGLSGTEGLGSLSSWLKETFTPGKVAEKKYNAASSENEKLVAEVTGKLNSLQNSLNEFQALKDKLTGGVATQKILLFGGGALLLSAIGYGIYQAVK